LLARQVFDMDVIAGHDLSENGPKNILNQPEYTTAIGLVKYGAQKVAQRRKSRRGLLGWLVG
jgi:cell division ATPase FtsA